MSTNENDSFVARWSRRKLGEPSPRPSSVGDAKDTGAPAADSASAEPSVDLSKLPDIEDLLPTSDISAFLRKGVRDELNKLALRKAWSLDPAIRDFIEVAENQYDWNAPNGVPGFGPIDTGTDINALLAQATGQLTETPLAAGESGLSEPHRFSTSGGLPAEKCGSDLNPTECEEGPLRDCAIASDESPMAIHKPVNDHASAGRKQQPKRHGGALPQLPPKSDTQRKSTPLS